MDQVNTLDVLGFMGGSKGRPRMGWVHGLWALEAWDAWSRNILGILVLGWNIPGILVLKGLGLVPGLISLGLGHRWTSGFMM